MRGNNRKILLVLLACVVCVLLSSGCSRDSAAHRDPSVLRISVGTEPSKLDPGKAYDTSDGIYINMLFEGLVSMDAEGRLVPAAAESWDISADQCTYIFHLRPNQWSNGEPVTARDFEYSWKRILDPQQASPFAYFLYAVVGAEEYNKGQGTREEVGIQVLDDHTLEVRLKQAVPYFLMLCANMSLMPVCADVDEQNEKWAAQADTLVVNGPFKLVSWKHYNHMVLTKNEFYWDRDSVKLSRIEAVLVDSAATRKALFDQGEIDFAMNVPLAALLRHQQEGNVAMVDAPWSEFIECNQRQPPLDDVRVRRAFALAMECDVYADAIEHGSAPAAYALVPSGILDPVTGQDFREEAGDLFHQDITEAKRLLAEAGYPDGEGFPPVTLLYNGDNLEKQMYCEALQQMWQKNLGVEVELRNQEWPVFNQSREMGQFQMAFFGYCADYLDPMTFLDYWMTDNPNNCSGYSNPQFDALLKIAQNSGDQAVRMQAMHDAEKIAIDDMAALPTSFRQAKYSVYPYVRGVVLSGVMVYFKDAWIDP